MCRKAFIRRFDGESCSKTTYLRREFLTLRRPFGTPPRQMINYLLPFHRLVIRQEYREQIQRDGIPPGFKKPDSTIAVTGNKGCHAKIGSIKIKKREWIPALLYLFNRVLSVPTCR